jgi:hypothetical protein
MMLFSTVQVIRDISVGWKDDCDDEVGNVRKETVMVYFKIALLSQNLHERAENSHIILGQSRSSCR